MNNAILTINATLGRDAAAKETGLEAKVKASMKAVIEGNWMSTSKDEVFRSGIGGALLDVGADSEDGKRLLYSVDVLKKFSAAMQAAQAGVSVDFSTLLPGEDDEQPLPLMAWYREVEKQCPQADALR